MDHAVWFRDAEIGSVTLEDSQPDGARTGLLQPTPDYWAHRPELQRLTLGLAALDGAPAERIQAEFLSALELIQSGRLELRDRTGDPVPVRWLMVGDYGPADLPATAWSSLPILVYAQFQEADTQR